MSVTFRILPIKCKVPMRINIFLDQLYRAVSPVLS